MTLREFPVPAGSAPHDVAPAADGGVWYTAQRSGELGWLDPKTGQTKHVKLGQGSSPHGVIVDRDGAPWITDSGLNAIVRVDPRTSEVTRYPIPRAGVNLNTAVFDTYGTLWFTGQSGVVGRLRLSGSTYPPSGVPEVISAPRGAGPYGITAVPFSGDVYYASLAGDHIAQVFSGPPVEAGAGPAGFSARPIDPPTPGAGPRRVWSDSKGVIWVSEWNAGQLGRYDPSTQQWKEWKLPGTRPQPYAVFVDDRDIVWLSDFGASAIVRFDPATERFDVFPHASGGNVRQLHGRPGEVWGALSALDKLLLVTTR
ncbi:MAG: lyase [Chloroflexi bacterium]|nr:lyase [Chloroflexota bacterium]